MGDEGAQGRVSWVGGSWTMANDVEQLTVEEAAREGLASASIAIGSGLKRVLHKEGITVSQILHLDGDWGG
jgi:hypothetical protein